MQKMFVTLVLAGIIMLAPQFATGKKSDAPGQIKKMENASWEQGQGGEKGHSGGLSLGQSSLPSWQDDEHGKNQAPGQIKKADVVIQSEEEENDNVCHGNRGSIWTVNSPDVQQDVNHYKPGERVYLNGKNFQGDEVTYAIYTNPPNSKGTLVASGTIQLVNGSISDVLIWDIPSDARAGEYKVIVTSCSGKKSDNFRIDKVKEQVCDDGDECNGGGDENGDENGDEDGNGEVKGEKTTKGGELTSAGSGTTGLILLFSFLAPLASRKLRKEIFA
jgi:hypothetical protein